MRIYVHSARNTYDETAIQVHSDDGAVLEVSNNGGSWQVQSRRPLDAEDRTTIPATPFWELAAERVGA